MTIEYLLQRKGDGYLLFVSDKDGNRLIAECHSGKHAHEVMTAWTWTAWHASRGTDGNG